MDRRKGASAAGSVTVLAIVLQLRLLVGLRGHPRQHHGSRAPGDCHRPRRARQRENHRKFQRHIENILLESCFFVLEHFLPSCGVDSFFTDIRQTAAPGRLHYGQDRRHDALFLSCLSGLCTTLLDLPVSNAICIREFRHRTLFRNTTTRGL
jgi:hypothetical protein